MSFYHRYLLQLNYSSFQIFYLLVYIASYFTYHFPSSVSFCSVQILNRKNSHFNDNPAFSITQTIECKHKCVAVLSYSSYTHPIVNCLLGNLSALKALLVFYPMADCVHTIPKAS